MAGAKCSRAGVEMVRLHCDHLNGSRPLDRGRRGARVDVVQREEGRERERDESDARGDDVGRPTGAAIIEFFFVSLCCVRLGNLTRVLAKALEHSVRHVSVPASFCFISNRPRLRRRSISLRERCRCREYFFSKQVYRRFRNTLRDSRNGAYKLRTLRTLWRCK